MKYLGIDYGSKRIGLAISDDKGTIAFPKSIIQNSQDIIQDILDLVEYEKIERIIIGKSLNQWGSENLIQRQIDTFIKKLSYDLEDGIEVIEQDERGSSIAAASHLYGKGNIANEKWTEKGNKKKREHNDANAAAIILQRFLDRQKKQM